MSEASSISHLRQDKDREEALAKHRLEAVEEENFNLKLRVYYLEENLSQNYPGEVAELLKLNAELRSQLDLRTRVLEERDVLLVKARHAIETLQADLELSKAESFHERHPTTAEVQAREDLAKLLKETNNSLHEAHSQHRLELDQRASVIADLQKQLEHRCSELRQSQDELHRLEHVQGELASVKAELEDSQANEKRLIREIKSLKTETSVIARDQNDMISTHERFHGTWVAEKSELQRLARETQIQHEATVADLRSRLQKLADENAQFAKSKHSVELDIARCRAENELLRDRVELLSKSLRNADSATGQVYNNTMSVLNGAREAELARERAANAQKLSKERESREEVEDRLRLEVEANAQLQRTQRKNNATTTALMQVLEQVCSALQSLSIPSFAISGHDRVQLYNDDVCPPVFGSDVGSVTVDHLDMVSVWIKRKLHRLKKIRRAFEASAAAIEEHFNCRMESLEKMIMVQQKQIKDVETRAALDWEQFTEKKRGGRDNAVHVDRLRDLHSSVLASLHRINAEIGTPGPARKR